MTKFEIGDTAPDFTLSSTDGGDFNLYGELENGPVLVNFYVGDFGLNCYNYSVRFVERYGELLDAGTRMVGVNSDSADSHRKWKERLEAPYDFLFDENKKVSTEYGAIVGPGHMVTGFTNREFYLIGGDRRIRYIWRADVPKTLPDFDEVLEGVKKGLALQF
ncbi:MAG: redoxin domain-containing protein [Thermoplasmatales archaeon]|jgi:peroxiredoxin Q/BCP|nr:redoxin domain-containing protein [Thermoplasmatales archaeon]